MGKFVSINRGHIDMNSIAIGGLNELRIKAKRPQTTNVSEFLSAIQENIATLLTVARASGGMFSVDVKGVPEGFRVIDVFEDRIQFLNMNDFAIRPANLQQHLDKGARYLHFSQMNEYVIKTQRNPETGSMNDILVAEDEYSSYPLFQNFSRDNKELMAGFQALQENGIDKEAFVNSLVEEIERVLSNREARFQKMVDDNIKSSKNIEPEASEEECDYDDDYDEYEEEY